MKKYNTAVFIHGCFWHRHDGCKYAYMPKSRVEFWTKKFCANVTRDRTVQQELKEQHVRCLIVWECTLKKVRNKNGVPDILIDEIADFLNSQDEYLEI